MIRPRQSAELAGAVEDVGEQASDGLGLDFEYPARARI